MRNCNPRITILLVALTLVCGTFRVLADGTPAPGAQPKVLGHLVFPTSTPSTDAQAAFVQGMLLMHLFEYPLALQQFRTARSIDPDFVMAYWGEAMTYNHPIWDEQDRDKARAVLDRLGATPAARQARTDDPKEKAYLAAIDILYGDGTKASRDHAYRDYMAGMAHDYPADQEVQLFYALALMGASEGVRDIPAYMQSAAIAQRVFCENPQHPGAAHYLIHAVDDPVHAPLGLAAARALETIAPDAGHAQHMTAHIYLALGMWDDVVRANQAAIRVLNNLLIARNRPPRHWGHYNNWLLYGLLQQGRPDAALTLLQEARADVVTMHVLPGDPMILDPDRSQFGSLVQMWARYVIDTQGRNAAVNTWTFDPGDSYDPALNLSFVQGLLAYWSGKPTPIEQALKVFRTTAASLRKRLLALPETPPSDLQYLERLEVMDLELQALLAMARDDRSAALAKSAEASEREGRMPNAFGPPFVDLPAAELHATLLAKAGQFQAAADAFKLQLQRTHRRRTTVRGLAEAQDHLGLSDEAARTRALLDTVRQPETTGP